MDNPPVDSSSVVAFSPYDQKATEGLIHQLQGEGCSALVDKLIQQTYACEEELQRVQVLAASYSTLMAGESVTMPTRIEQARAMYLVATNFMRAQGVDPEAKVGSPRPRVFFERK